MIMIGTNPKLTLYPERPYLLGPYNRAALFTYAHVDALKDVSSSREGLSVSAIGCAQCATSWDFALPEGMVAEREQT